MPESFFLSILVNTLYFSESKIFVKEVQTTTIASSLDQEKIWEEWHYDQFLTIRAMMIPSQGYY